LPDVQGEGVKEEKKTAEKLSFRLLKKTANPFSDIGKF